MAGTRTAPTVNGTPVTKYVSLHFIDITGDEKTTGDRFPAAATDAQIEAWAAAEQAASSGSLYKVSTTYEYTGAADKNNAVLAEKSEVSNVINRLFKKTDGSAKSVPILAPVPDCFVSSDSDDPTIVSPSPIPATLTALLALLGAGWDAVSLRYTSRKQQNPAVKL